ncbi:MAG: MgtC/SapB family protein [Nitrosopumilus sp.]
MLVSLGATVFTIISLSFDIEPSRIAAGIVTGIGFLGAGSIIAHKGHIRGITSAATLWVVAGIGLSIGVGQYIIAITSSLLVFAILQLGRIENRYDVDEKKM